MTRLALQRHALRLATWCVLATGLASCVTWRVKPLPLRDIIEARQSGTVRLTLEDGRHLVMDRPVIVGDSLVGLVSHRLTSDDWARDAVALRDIRQVAVQEVDAGRTLLAGAVVVGTVVAVTKGTENPPAPPAPAHVPSTGGGMTLGNLGIGSCPHLYSWDGQRWRLDSGTFGGAITAGAQRADVDNLAYAVPQGDTLRLRLASEMPETDHVDAVTVLAVDHEPDATVAPDGAGRLHAFGALAAPRTARDARGRDVRDLVLAEDGHWWESDLLVRDTARLDDVRDGIMLTFARPLGAASAHLVLDATNTPIAADLLGALIMAHGRATQAWYDSLDASPLMVAGLDAVLSREAFLTVWLRTPSGWVPQGVAWEAGAEVMKRQVVPLDLGAVTGDTLVVKLESAAGFWRVDRASISFGADRALAVHELRPDRAVTHDGRIITNLLAYRDGRVLDSENGEWADLTYVVPAVPAGMARSYLVRSEGWYRVRAPAEGEPDVALLRRVGAEPYAMSREAVAKLNEVLAARQVPPAGAGAR